MELLSDSPITISCISLKKRTTQKYLRPGSSETTYIKIHEIPLLLCTNVLFSYVFFSFLKFKKKIEVRETDPVS